MQTFQNKMSPSFAILERHSLTRTPLGTRVSGNRYTKNGHHNLLTELAKGQFIGNSIFNITKTLGVFVDSLIARIKKNN